MNGWRAERNDRPPVQSAKRQGGISQSRLVEMRGARSLYAVIGLAGVTGFDPAHGHLTGDCSTGLSSPPAAPFLVEIDVSTKLSVAISREFTFGQFAPRDFFDRFPSVSEQVEVQFRLDALIRPNH